MPSGPFQIVLGELFVRLSSEIALLPLTYSIRRMRSGDCQKNELTEAFRLRVRLTTPRPPTVMVNSSVDLARRCGRGHQRTAAARAFDVDKGNALAIV